MLFGTILAGAGPADTDASAHAAFALDALSNILNAFARVVGLMGSGALSSSRSV